MLESFDLGWKKSADAPMVAGKFGALIATAVVSRTTQVHAVFALASPRHDSNFAIDT
jgi:hypothetical protein